jgi:hypothetical protein
MRVWRRVTRRLRVWEVPGNHNTCVVGEGVAALGATIRACLDEEISPRR